MTKVQVLCPPKKIPDVLASLPGLYLQCTRGHMLQHGGALQPENINTYTDDADGMHTVIFLLYNMMSISSKVYNNMHKYKKAKMIACIINS